ncbi:MAG: hypothetical protein HC843_08395 [Sphingomonadales bacterium]|nr:hypothetical protein [Sphingomonadales bacterium]
MSRALFSHLESSPAFRGEMRYFLQLAGNYIANIFIQVRAKSPSKHRKAFAQWLGTQPSSVKDKQLYDALVCKAEWFEAYKRDFAIMLDDMPPVMRDRMGRSIQNDHCIPLDMAGFIRSLDRLREYRHWLEHYKDHAEKNQKRPVTEDSDILRDLGLLLVPHLLNHLHGRIRHHQRKLKTKNVFGR